MSKSYLCSDWHLGHKNIIKWSGDFRQGDTPEENAELLLSNAGEILKKRDTLYCLGDMFFDEKYIEAFKTLPGKKILLRGNHDKMHTCKYLKIFAEVYGLRTFKGFWLSHGPVHPDELRGRKSIHGHCHQKSIMLNGKPDPRYINVCVENTNGYPIDFDLIREDINTWQMIR